MVYPLRALRIFSSFALLLIAASASAIVSVGPKSTNPDNPSDPYYGCRFQSIQDAINYIHDYELTLDPEDPDPSKRADHYIAIAGSGTIGDGVYNEKLVIDGSDITWPEGFRIDFFGGYDDLCDQAVGSRTLIGAGGSQSGNSVLEVKGHATVYLHDLIMTDGDVFGHGAGEGGGINFHGSGLLDITGVDITGNYANSGGGIFSHGEGDGLTVSLHAGTFIESNTAAAASGGFSAGGGISFTGHGSLLIDNTQILSNTADFGGGVYIDPDAATTANLLDSVSLFLNTANESGGAIFIKGNTSLFANSASQTLIGLNKAPGGYGGGVAVSGPAKANLSANIFSNTANYGGGIALLAGHGQFGDNAVVTLTAPGSNAPVNVSGNTAYQTGGGIYLKPFTNNDFYTYAKLCASDFRFDLNAAQEGTAIYADEDFNSILGFDKIYVGSSVHLNDNAACNTHSICSVGSSCNEIKQNSAVTASFQPTDGATILIQTASNLVADRFVLQHNDGGHAIRVVDEQNKNDFSLDLGNCLISNNQFTHELFYLDSDLVLDDCTITHNTIGAQHAIRVAGYPVIALNSIFDQDVDTFDYAGNTDATVRTLLFLMTNHPDPTLPLNPTVSVGTPHFVNPDQSDYHLLPDSPGLDAALADGRHFDLDGYSRDVDLPLVPNFPYPGATAFRDLGAYELQLFQLPPPPGCAQSDTIFCDGFE